MSVTKQAANTLAVDWDGTCVESVWPRKNGDWLPGAVESLTKLLADGWSITIHTSRIAPTRPSGGWRSWGAIDSEIETIRKKLDEAGLQAVKIHTEPWKPPAMFYIDDRAIPFTTWKDTLRKVRR